MRCRVRTGSRSTGMPVAVRTSSICRISLSTLLLCVFMSNSQGCLYGARTTATRELRLAYICLAKSIFHGKGQFVRHQRRNGVAYLRELLYFVTAELEEIWKTLKSRRLANGDSAPSTVEEPHSLHVACRPREVAARDGTRRHIGIKVSRTGAMRLAFVLGDVSILFRRQYPRSVRYRLHGITDSIGDCCDPLLVVGESE